MKIFSFYNLKSLFILHGQVFVMDYFLLQSVNIHQLKDGRNGVVNNQIQDWSFRLDGIFHNSTQDQVFDTVASNIVTSALDGYNGNVYFFNSFVVIKIKHLCSPMNSDFITCKF